MTLCPRRGRLYIGYGDYQSNTGPIDVTAWDPVRADFVTVHSSDTEAIDNDRVIGDELYAPATDPRQHADYAVGEPWRDQRPVTAAHAYDIVTLDGREAVPPGRVATAAVSDGAAGRVLRVGC